MPFETYGELIIKDLKDLITNRYRDTLREMVNDFNSEVLTKLVVPHAIQIIIMAEGSMTAPLEILQVTEVLFHELCRTRPKQIGSSLAVS